MAADWEKLGASYKDSETVLIVDVDCTADGQSTCQSHGVQGYPTIQYFMAGSKKGKPYQQGRDFNSLKQFVESTLNKATCNAKTGAGCAPNEKQFLEKQKGKSPEELKAEFDTKTEQLKALKKEMSEAEAEWKTKEKEFKKKEKNLQKSVSLLKQLTK
jgi:protein disulfide-isomerase A6